MMKLLNVNVDGPTSRSNKVCNIYKWVSLSFQRCKISLSEELHLEILIMVISFIPNRVLYSKKI